MKPLPVTKREFLKLTLAGAATAMSGWSGLATAGAADQKKKIPVALQLYSVRNECAKDLVGTVTAVGKMGYKGVEFAGYHGRDAKTLRKLLDENGLVCCGTHIGLETLLGDTLPRTIEFNKTLGNQFLIVPGLAEKYRKTRQAWEETADLFSELAEKVRPEGMHVGYHNHNIEFKRLDGEVPWDTFFNRTKKDVVIQFDTGNGYEAGGDPMIYLKKHPGRVASVHVKPYSKTKPNALLGSDELPWKEIFNICETTAGTQWYIIEYESDAYPPLISVAKSLDVMRGWSKC
jgi:sugar phosphate isomerase/epimerase